MHAHGERGGCSHPHHALLTGTDIRCLRSWGYVWPQCLVAICARVTQAVPAHRPLYLSPPAARRRSPRLQVDLDAGPRLPFAADRRLRVDPSVLATTSLSPALTSDRHAVLPPAARTRLWTGPALTRTAVAARSRRSQSLPGPTQRLHLPTSSPSSGTGASMSTAARSRRRRPTRPTRSIARGRRPAGASRAAAASASGSAVRPAAPWRSGGLANGPEARNWDQASTPRLRAKARPGQSAAVRAVHAIRVPCRPLLSKFSATMHADPGADVAPRHAADESYCGLCAARRRRASSRPRSIHLRSGVAPPVRSRRRRESARRRQRQRRWLDQRGRRTRPASLRHRVPGPTAARRARLP